MNNLHRFNFVLMKRMILYNWNLFRALRLILGVAIIVQAAMARDMLFAIAGLLFTVMALFNVGCCGTGTCYPAQKNDTTTITPVKDITYEEVV